jgi:endonuclease/exonuclease/phosphatase family metal-dependent hydrolase
MNPLHKYPFSARLLTLPATLILACLFGCNIEITTENPKSESNDTLTTNSTTVAANRHVPGETVQPHSARVMTYNVQFFNTEAANYPPRVDRLRQILSDIGPDVVAIEEVEDRAAMHLVFPPDQWQILMDDDSVDKQDTAIAVRRPWSITNAPADLDADDPQFLAPGDAVESYFPIRRDALFAQVATPGGDPAFTVVAVHAKARVGGRTNTDPRRIGASRFLLDQFRTRLKGQNIVLMGDFNDSPDDVSLNILETGDPNAPAGANPWPSDYMVNLLQPLWEKGQVTEGASDRRLDRKTGLVNNSYPDARSRNNNARGRNAGTGPIMFDQILVSKALAPGSNPEPGKIYLKPIALTGPGYTRPSDHLPVYADIKIP